MGTDEKKKTDVVLQDVHLDEVLAGLISPDTDQIVKALRQVPSDVNEVERAEIVAYLRSLVSSKELRVRAALAQTMGRLIWRELTPTLFRALNDPDSVVRLNAAKSLLERPRVGALLEQAFTAATSRAVTALIRVIEQDRKRQHRVFELIVREDLAVTKATILVESPILRERLANFLEELSIDPREYAAVTQQPTRTHSN